MKDFLNAINTIVKNLIYKANNSIQMSVIQKNVENRMELQPENVLQLEKDLPNCSLAL